MRGWVSSGIHEIGLGEVKRIHGEMDKVIDGKSDLEFTVKVDLMPEFELTDVAKLKVEKLVSDAQTRVGSIA